MEPRIPNPTPEEIRWCMQEARRLRSETVHELLESAGVWLAGAPRTRMPETRSIVGEISRA